MRLYLHQLEAFWASATQHHPLIVLGGGRWGRTLTEVAARARGDAYGIAVIARSNYAHTCEWRDRNPLLAALEVSQDLASSAEHLEAIAKQPPVAIIASRPRDHFRDASACLALNLDTLVEKPLVSDPVDADPLLQTALARQRVLALGVELSLTPAFHYAVNQLTAPIAGATLEWTDPPSEFRYGQVKRRHEEVHVLSDNLPHAISIFRVLVPDAGFSLAAAELDANGTTGTVSLTCGGARFSLNASRTAPARQRVLRIDASAGRVITVDFSTPHCILSIAGTPRPMPAEWDRMNSTLRLEVGALFAQVTDRLLRTPLTHDLREYAQIESALHAALA